MPSPFPGMDPYLEHPEFFAGLHDALIIYLRQALQPLLPPAYFADNTARIWAEHSGEFFKPDLEIVGSDRPTPQSRSRTATQAVEAVLIDASEIDMPGEELRETFLEIRTTQGDQPLVTVVEVLSPTNKTIGERSRNSYKEKQADYLHSRVNLVEIDLLRGGEHSTAVARWRAERQLGKFDYHVCVYKFDRPDKRLVYPIQLENCLPILEIPLLPGDGGVRVNLQQIFDQCHDTGPYAKANPYSRSPKPALSSARTTWAKALLRKRGLLPRGKQS